MRAVHVAQTGHAPDKGRLRQMKKAYRELIRAWGRRVVFKGHRAQVE